MIIMNNIHITKDYEKFTFPRFGRPMSYRYISKYVDWVNQPQDGRHRRLSLIAFQLTIPIQVDGHMQILEGKHRFEIARLLDLPIHYVIVKKVNPVYGSSIVVPLDSY